MTRIKIGEIEVECEDTEECSNLIYWILTNPKMRIEVERELSKLRNYLG